MWVCDLCGLLRPMFHLSVPVNTDLCDAFHKSPNEAQSRWQACEILYMCLHTAAGTRAPTYLYTNSYVSSDYYICVLIILYMCLDTTM